jgi:hypothetical protein
VRPHDASEPAFGAMDAAKEREAVANDFATELLTPWLFARALCDRNRPSLADVAVIARTFDVSLTMAALRFMELAPEACGVVYAEGGRVVWSARNDDFRVRLPDRGARIDASTSVGASELRSGLTRVDADAWGDAREDVELWEEPALLEDYDASLTWLWHPQ